MKIIGDWVGDSCVVLNLGAEKKSSFCALTSHKYLFNTELTFRLAKIIYLPILHCILSFLAVMFRWLGYVISIAAIVMQNAQIASAADGDPYGLINAVETECEYQGLTWGSRLADGYNSLDESVQPSDRLSMEIFQESPSFLKLLHAEIAVRPNSFKEVNIQRHHGLKHRLGAPAFASVDNRWVYFLGDSSLFYVWEALQTGALMYNKKAMTDRSEECLNLEPLPPRKTR